MSELSDEEFLERVAYIRFAFSHKKSEVDSSRLSEALITTFQQGYSGNHQPFHRHTLTLHRGRIATDGRPFPRLSDHWYPPPRYSGYNRANMPGESVFYCSNGSGTSLLELRPKPGDLVSMMTCQISKEPIRLKWISQADMFGLLQPEGRRGEFERLCAEIYAYGTASPTQYLICGAFASLFFRLDFIDGIAYLSVATSCKGVNIALKGSVADQYVKPLSFRAFRVSEAVSEFDFRVMCVASAGPPDDDGTIAWKPIPSCDGHIVNWSIFDRPMHATSKSTGCAGNSVEVQTPIAIPNQA